MSNSITGRGSSDSHALVLNDNRPNPHPSAGQAYQTISFQQVYDMLVDPPTVDKDKAPWIIPSTYHGYDGRSHAAQREHGQFCWLAADIDKGSPTLEQVLSAVRKVIPGAGFAVYSSRSSAPGKFKWRVLVPLQKLIPGDWYGAYAAAFFDGLEYLGGLDVDRTLERTGQVVYLPNRGDHYQYHVEYSEQLYDVYTHKQLSARASDYVQAQQAISASGGAADKTGPFISQYTARNTIASLLTKYGYVQKGNSDHYRSPYQDSTSYGTQDRGDHWLSLSHSDAAKGLGRPTINGSRYGDAFDLYVHFEHGGDWTKAVAAVKAVQYGCATSGVLLGHTDSDGEFHAVWPKPDRALGNGWDLAQKVIEKHFRDIAETLAKELATAKEIAEKLEMMKVAKKRRVAGQWGGDWVNDVPFPIEPNELEWAAWHAPGIVGQAVREMSVTSTRQSLVPLMAGAIAAVSFVTMGKYVLKWKHHVTPSSIMMYLVGETGSGKSDAMSMFYRLTACVEESYIKAKKIRDFTSGAAVIDFMANQGSNVMILQNEAGMKRSVGMNDNHQLGVIGEITDLYTAFERGTEALHAKSEGKSTKSVANPCLSALMTSTPDKMFGAIDGSDAESGWLGRQLFLPLTTTSEQEDTPENFRFSDDLVSKMVWLGQVLPPSIINNSHPDVWQGAVDYYHVKRYTETADERMRQLTRDYDAMMRDLRRGGAERAVYGRTKEAISRLSFVVGLGKLTTQVDLAAVEFAEMVVRSSIALVTSRMDDVVEKADGSDGSKVRKYIHRIFDRLHTAMTITDPKKISESDRKLVLFFRNSSRISVDGRLEVGRNTLTSKTKEGTNMSHQLVKTEIEGMVDLHELLIIETELGSKKQWVTLRV